MRLIYVLLNVQLMASNGLLVNKRLRQIEPRLTNVEIQLNFGLKDLTLLKDSVQVLNDTLSEANDTACSVKGRERNDRDESGRQNALTAKDDKGLTGEFKQHVLKALGEEKYWIRNEIKGLKNLAHRQERDFGDIQKNVNDTMDTFNVRFKALENRLETLITNEVGKLNTMLTNAMNDTDNEIKFLQSEIKHNEETIKTFKEHVSNLQTQSSQHATLLSNIESEIDDKVSLKLLEELEGRMACLPNWRQFMGYCYNLHTDAVDFETAIGICLNEAAFIADIRSEDENEYLNKLSQRHIWIGITDREDEGKWVSVRNGKPLVYANWDINQPQNFADYDEDCMVMRNAEGLKWHDYRCDVHKFAFICKKMVE